MHAFLFTDQGTNQPNVGTNQPKAECASDNDCWNSLHGCIHGSCKQPVCKDRCGMNAMCVIKNHQSCCRCFRGVTGDPVKGCFSYDSKYYPFIDICNSKMVYIFKYNFTHLSNNYNSTIAQNNQRTNIDQQRHALKMVQILTRFNKAKFWRILQASLPLSPQLSSP